jgi:hypothetical protein
VCDAAGACTGSTRSCDDGLSCTNDLCNEGAARCDHVVRAGFCVLDGACWRSGEVNPASPACQYCDPATSATAWTANEGAACDDGQFCTASDVCDAAGACGGGPRACADTLTCTTDTCTEATDACDHRSTRRAAHRHLLRCRAVDPSNRASLRSGQSDWSLDRAACDDGEYCTTADTHL